MKKVLALALTAAMAVSMAPAAMAATVTGTWDGGTVSGGAWTGDASDNGYTIGDTAGLGYSSSNPVKGVPSEFARGDFRNLPDEIEFGNEFSPSNHDLYYGLGTMIWYTDDANNNTFKTGFWNETATTIPVVTVGTTDYALWYDGMTYGEVKDGKWDVELRVTNGQRVVDDVEMKYLDSVTVPGTTRKYTFAKNDRPAYIKIEFVDKFISTSDVDYKFKVYLTKDKKRQEATEVIFEGNFENNMTTVDEDDVYVYLGDDVPVVESLAYLKDIEVELDGGITVFTKFFNNKKYYGFGEAKVRDEDDAIITKYPAIDYVYNIDSVGLNNSYSTVKLDISDKLYVYNANLEYIGTTDEKLPFSSKYYVSAVELDVDGEDVTEPTESDPGDDFESDPGMGGDDVPENVNDNPGTGC